MMKSCTAPPSAGADEDPEGARQVAKLGREHGTDEGAGAADRREVMAKDDPFVRLDEVFPILMHLARGGPAVVEREHLGRDPFGIKAVAEGIRAERGDDDEAGVHGFGALGGDGPVAKGAEESDGIQMRRRIFSRENARCNRHRGACELPTRTERPSVAVSTSFIRKMTNFACAQPHYCRRCALPPSNASPAPLRGGVPGPGASHNYHALPPLHSHRNPRKPPAGLVSATFDAAAGLLTMNGDTADNSVHVFNTGTNTYRIEGTSGTDIGTMGDAFTDFVGKLSSVVINGGPGSDSFILTNLTKLKDLTFNGEAGSDSLTAFNLKTKGAVTANFGPDGGSASFDGVTSIGKDLTVNYGDGGGAVSIIGTSGAVKGAVTLNGGAGADSFELGANTGRFGERGEVHRRRGGEYGDHPGSDGDHQQGRGTGNAIEFIGGADGNTLDVLGSRR